MGFIFLGSLFHHFFLQFLPIPIRLIVDTQEELTNTMHPYGRSVTGVVLWENDRKFHEFCAKTKISTRMAAFQTTLPDPLPGEEYNVALAADRLAGIILEPGEIFSMNSRLGPYNEAKGYREGPTYMGGRVVKTIGGGVCKIASTLYNVTVLANLQIIQRNHHGMQVPYVPPGQDATVYYGAKDFIFRNNAENPVFLWADTKDNTLFIAIYGRSKPPEVRWHHRTLKRFPTYTVYRYRRNMQPSEKKIIVPGADGLIVRSWLTIHYPDGKVETKSRGVSYYNPLPEIVEVGDRNL